MSEDVHLRHIVHWQEDDCTSGQKQCFATVLGSEGGGGSIEYSLQRAAMSEDLLKLILYFMAAAEAAAAYRNSGYPFLSYQ